MRLVCACLFGVSAISMPSAASSLHAVSGSASAIQKVISGKTCVGPDVIEFGKASLGSPGSFERAGHPQGNYTVGYGTILIDQGNSLHGYVAAVSSRKHDLYMSTHTYVCGR